MTTWPTSALRNAARAAVLALAAPAWAATCYVNTHVSGGAHNGTSWANAYADLPSALNATVCQAAGSQIWVAHGVYKPTTTPTDRDAAFHILPGMQVYGGFAGTESQRSQAQPGVNVTVLSGDIDGNDTQTDGVTLTAAGIQGANSVHVVVMGGTDFNNGNADIGASTVLDGLTITGGQANGGIDTHTFWGGGLLCNGAGHACSPTLSRLSFRGNFASVGGAIANNSRGGGDSSPTISQSTFSGNAATWGGAIYNSGDAGTSRPTISQSTFSGNTADAGGAIYNNANNGVSSPVIRFVTFSGNQATGTGSNGFGGAIFTAGVGTQISLPNVAYSVFWGNTATQGGSQAWTRGDAHTNFADSLIEGGCASGGSGGGTCTGAPLTSNPALGPLQDNGGPTHTMLPGATGASAAVNAVACPADVGTDQRGVARPQGGLCDLGAVEPRQGSFGLTVTVTGQGSVSGGKGACASTNSGCSVLYVDEADPLNPGLQARPAPGYTFTGWGGACTGTAPTCTVTMDQARSVTAHFALTSNTDPGTGIQTAIGGTASCVFTAAPTWAAPGAARTPLPRGYSFPYGELNWSAQGCSVGGTAVITVTLPGALPAGTRLFKWVGNAWTAWTLTPVSGNPNAFTYQVTDNASGDSNATGGAITDPALLAVPLGAPHPQPTPVPTLGQWALMLLGLLAAGLGARRQRGI